MPLQITINAGEASAQINTLAGAIRQLGTAVSEINTHLDTTGKRLAGLTKLTDLMARFNSEEVLSNATSQRLIAMAGAVGELSAKAGAAAVGLRELTKAQEGLNKALEAYSTAIATSGKGVTIRDSAQAGLADIRSSINELVKLKGQLAEPVVINFNPSKTGVRETAKILEAIPRSIDVAINTNIVDKTKGGLASLEKTVSGMEKLRATFAEPVTIKLGVDTASFTAVKRELKELYGPLRISVVPFLNQRQPALQQQLRAVTAELAGSKASTVLLFPEISPSGVSGPRLQQELHNLVRSLRPPAIPIPVAIHSTKAELEAQLKALESSLALRALHIPIKPKLSGEVQQMMAQAAWRVPVVLEGVGAARAVLEELRQGAAKAGAVPLQITGLEAVLKEIAAVERKLSVAGGVKVHLFGVSDFYKELDALRGMLKFSGTVQLKIDRVTEETERLRREITQAKAGLGDLPIKLLGVEQAREALTGLGLGGKHQFIVQVVVENHLKVLEQFKELQLSLAQAGALHLRIEGEAQVKEVLATIRTTLESLGRLQLKVDAQSFKGLKAQSESVIKAMRLDVVEAKLKEIKHLAESAGVIAVRVTGVMTAEAILKEFKKLITDMGTLSIKLIGTQEMDAAIKKLGAELKVLGEVNLQVLGLKAFRERIAPLSKTLRAMGQMTLTPVGLNDFKATLRTLKKSIETTGMVKLRLDQEAAKRFRERLQALKDLTKEVGAIKLTLIGVAPIKAEIEALRKALASLTLPAGLVQGLTEFLTGMKTLAASKDSLFPQELVARVEAFNQHLAALTAHATAAAKAINSLAKGQLALAGDKKIDFPSLGRLVDIVDMLRAFNEAIVRQEQPIRVYALALADLAVAVDLLGRSLARLRLAKLEQLNALAGAVGLSQATLSGAGAASGQAADLARAQELQAQAARRAGEANQQGAAGVRQAGEAAEKATKQIKDLQGATQQGAFGFDPVALKRRIDEVAQALNALPRFGKLPWFEGQEALRGLDATKARLQELQAEITRLQQLMATAATTSMQMSPERRAALEEEVRLAAAKLPFLMQERQLQQELLRETLRRLPVEQQRQALAERTTQVILTNQAKEMQAMRELARTAMQRYQGELEALNRRAAHHQQNLAAIQAGEDQLRAHILRNLEATAQLFVVTNNRIADSDHRRLQASLAGIQEEMQMRRDLARMREQLDARAGIGLAQTARPLAQIEGERQYREEVRRTVEFMAARRNAEAIAMATQGRERQRLAREIADAEVAQTQRVTSDYVRAIGSRNTTREQAAQAERAFAAERERLLNRQLELEQAIASRSPHTTGLGMRAGLQHTAQVEELARLRAQIAGMDQAAHDAVRGLGLLDQAILALTGRTKDSVQVLAALRALMMGLGRSFGFFGASVLVTGAAVYGLTRTFRNALTTGVEFSEAMTRSFAILGDMGQQMSGRLTSEVRRLARETIFTATEVARGLQLLGQSGLTARESIAALPSVLYLSSIGQLDMARAADISTDIMMQFGMTVADLPTIIDKMAQAVVASNTNIEQLGTALSYVGPIAAEAGTSFDNTIVLIQMLANVGIKATRAGTTLRRMFTQLAAPAGKVSETLFKLDLSIHNVAGEMEDLSDVMRKLALSSAGVGDIRNLFGLWAAPGALALIRTLRREIREVNGERIIDDAAVTRSMTTLRKQLAESEGAAEKMAHAIEDHLGADAKIAISAMADAAISLFDIFKDDLRLAVQKVTDVFTRFAKVLQDPTHYVHAFFTVLGNAGRLIGWFVGLMTDMAAEVHNMFRTSLFRGLGGGFDIMIANLERLASVLISVIGIVSDLLNLLTVDLFDSVFEWLGLTPEPGHLEMLNQLEEARVLLEDMKNLGATGGQAQTIVVTKLRSEGYDYMAGQVEKMLRGGKSVNEVLAETSKRLDELTVKQTHYAKEFIASIKDIAPEGQDRLLKTAILGLEIQAVNLLRAEETLGFKVRNILSRGTLRREHAETKKWVDEELKLLKGHFDQVYGVQDAHRASEEELAQLRVQRAHEYAEQLQRIEEEMAGGLEEIVNRRIRALERESSAIELLTDKRLVSIQRSRTVQINNLAEQQDIADKLRDRELEKLEKDLAQKSRTLTDLKGKKLEDLLKAAKDESPFYSAEALAQAKEYAEKYGDIMSTHAQTREEIAKKILDLELRYQDQYNAQVKAGLEFYLEILEESLARQQQLTQRTVQASDYYFEKGKLGAKRALDATVEALDAEHAAWKKAAQQRRVNMIEALESQIRINDETRQAILSTTSLPWDLARAFQEAGNQPISFKMIDRLLELPEIAGDLRRQLELLAAEHRAKMKFFDTQLARDEKQILDRRYEAYKRFEERRLQLLEQSMQRRRELFEQDNRDMQQQVDQLGENLGRMVQSLKVKPQTAGRVMSQETVAQIEALRAEKERRQDEEERKFQEKWKMRQNQMHHLLGAGGLAPDVEKRYSDALEQHFLDMRKIAIETDDQIKAIQKNGLDQITQYHELARDREMAVADSAVGYREALLDKEEARIRAHQESIQRFRDAGHLTEMQAAHEYAGAVGQLIDLEKQRYGIVRQRIEEESERRRTSGLIEGVPVNKLRDLAKGTGEAAELARQELQRVDNELGAAQARHEAKVIELENERLRAAKEGRKKRAEALATALAHMFELERRYNETLLEREREWMTERVDLARTGFTERSLSFAQATQRMEKVMDDSIARQRAQMEQLRVLLLDQMKRVQGAIAKTDPLAPLGLALREVLNGLEEQLRVLNVDLALLEDQKQVDLKLNADQMLRDLESLASAAQTYNEELETQQATVKLGLPSYRSAEYAHYALMLAKYREKEATHGLTDAEAGYVKQLAATMEQIAENEDQLRALEAMRQLTDDVTQGVTDAFVEMVKTGKFEFSDLIDHVLSELFRMVVQFQIVEPLFKGLFGGGGGGGGGGGLLGAGLSAATGFFSGGAQSAGVAAAVHHAGGVVGMDQAPMRMVDAALFDRAPRFHGGGDLASDEVPTILQRGESVLTREQMRMLSPAGQGGGEVMVQVIDQRSGGEPAQVQRQQGPNGREVIRVLIRDEVNRGFGNGSFDKQLGTNFGIRRNGARR